MKFFKKHPDQFDFALERLCLTCENKFQGRYCNKCGEKVIEAYDRSIKHFFDNLLNAFTFIDGKFLNSFKMMLFKPGQMSADIVSDHLVFTFELTTYILFVPTILLSFLVSLFNILAGIFGFDTSQIEIDTYILPIVAILVGYMLFFGLKRFYQLKWWRTILSTTTILASLVVVIYFYRFLLFVVTMWSLK